jgi:hypothetical protein
MKAKTSHFNLQIVLFSAFILIFFRISSFNQTNEWALFTNGNYVNSIAEEGNYLWIGSDGGGLIKLDKRNGQFYVYTTLNSGLPSQFVQTIAIDKQGVKWIGT